MNPSHSPTLSITDPLRTTSKVPGASSDRSSGERASDSFNALYQSETASLDGANRTKDKNINKLDDRNEKNNDVTSQVRAEEDTGAMVAGESNLRDSIDETTALVEHHVASEDQAFETELLHGISFAMPSSSNQTKVGEKLPLGGKELPPSGKHSEPELVEALTRSGTEPEIQGRSDVSEGNDRLTQGKVADLNSTRSDSSMNEDRLQAEVLTRADTGPEIRGRSDVGERSDHLRQNKVADLNSTRSDPSMNEHKLETAQFKVQSEPFTESLSLLASKPLQDPATALAGGSNSPANLAAVVSQVDATAAQKLSLAVDAAANTDLNGNTRGSNFDRSNALGEKIHWMHNAKISTAELHLHPAELGSIEIKIVTEDQQARVSFITSSASARDVIEESLPKLRELLADSGLALDQSDISQKDSGDEPARKDRQALPENLHIEREIEREFTVSSISTRIGQVDHYV